MERKTNRRIFDSIVKSLSTGPKSIHEIAQESGTNWETVRNHLEILKGIGYISERSEGKSRIFSLRPLGTHPDTLFGLPLDKGDENLINLMFMRIRDEWVRITNKQPSKTQVQKVLVEVNKRLNLNIPTAWYLFGKMCLKMYDPERDYDYEEVEDPRLEKEIAASVNDLSQKTVSQLRKYQYAEEENSMYMIKENIIQMLKYYELNRENTGRIYNLMIDFISNLQASDERGRFVSDVAREVIGSIITVMSTNTDLEKFRTDLTYAFEDLWRIVALYCLEKSLKENAKYNGVDVFEYIRRVFEHQFDIIKNHVSRLAELEVKEEHSEGFSEFRKLKGSAKTHREMTKEERKRLAEGLVE